MFCKLVNQLDLANFWMNSDEIFLNVSDNDKDAIFEAISNLIHILDNSYGENRNPEISGGFIMVFFDNYADKQRDNVLAYYHLSDTEYELQDILAKDEEGYVWISEIYCGTNYNIVLIYKKCVCIDNC